MNMPKMDCPSYNDKPFDAKWFAPDCRAAGFLGNIDISLRRLADAQDAAQENKALKAILAEMLALAEKPAPGIRVRSPWQVEGGWRDKDGQIQEELAQINTTDFECVSNIKDGLIFKSVAEHIVALHNLWVRVVEKFGNGKEMK